MVCDLYARIHKRQSLAYWTGRVVFVFMDKAYSVPYCFSAISLSYAIFLSVA